MSPVFDVASELLIVEIERSRIRRRAVRSIGVTSAAARAQLMIELGIGVLICGAISQEPARLLRSRGVRILPNRCGDAHAVLDAYMAGEIDDPRYAMPGRQRRGEPSQPKKATGTVRTD